MKQTILFLVLATMSMVALAAGDEAKAEEKRPLKGFERIEMQGNLDVRYRQGNAFSVVVRAPRAVIKHVETRVEDNKLVVRMKPSSSIFSLRRVSGADVTVLVTSPDLIGVELSGSGDFECRTHLDTDVLDLKVKGSGDIDFWDVICDRVNVSVTGSGDAELKKLVAQQSNLQLVGSGDVKVNQQNVSLTRIELKGSGDVKVGCTQCGKVEARLMGSGDITLTGDVRQLNKTVRGSGDVETKGLKVNR